MEFSNGFLLSLSLCLDIGLANIAMITLSMQRGFSKGLWLGLGTCVGDLAYAVLAMLGMAVLLCNMKPYATCSGSAVRRCWPGSASGWS